MNRDIHKAQQAINGDDQAFLSLMDTYKVDLYKTALSYLKNEGEALEAIQEVTFRAYKNIHKVKEKQYVKTWLIRIMINYCIDQLRKKKRMVLDEDIISAIGVVDNYVGMELNDAMEALDDRSREILLLMYFHNLKIKEIAVTMERPEGTIKTWLHRALFSLRKELGEKGGDKHAPK